MSNTQVPQYNGFGEAPVVMTQTGAVQGRWQNASSAEYLGIPFAAAPVGRLRFLAPQAVEPWSGIRSAIDYGPTPQRRPFGPVSTIPEPSIAGDSTLNVNVFTPAPRDRRAHLPVLVWIHGGGYFAGSPSSSWYNGSGFNADGIVTVSLSYRLGFQGFGWVDGASMNRGLLDQIAALEWVQRNIEEFGGDPSRVTIAGQSAGAGSAISLMGSPRATGLFRAAISESAPSHTITVSQAETVGRALAKRIGVQPSLDAWSEVSETTILDNERELNNVADVPAGPSSAADLVELFRQGYAGGSNLAYAPVIDGEVLARTPKESFSMGASSDVSLLMGSVRNEFSFPAPGQTDLQEAQSQFRQAGFSDGAIAQFTSEVHRIGADRLAGQLLTTYMFRAGVAETAKMRLSGGAGSKTWLYDFAQTSSISNASMHCDEIPYVFDVLGDPKVASVLGHGPSQSLADSVHGTWTRLIADGELEQPSVNDSPCGAIQFLGSMRYDSEAYRFERELIDATSHTQE
ncbi:carboxylesterase/lipase family protein [Bifidobacterium sp.]|uniref:carboxylesterase/lipase family protein n=1 Tax=Bifidobacterium sp. TaxID=41200 RepID=UPI0039EB559C